MLTKTTRKLGLIITGLLLFTSHCKAQANCSCLFGKQIGEGNVTYIIPNRCESLGISKSEDICKQVCFNEHNRAAHSIQHFYGPNHQEDCQTSLNNSNSKCFCSCLLGISDPNGTCQFRGDITDTPEQCARSCIPSGAGPSYIDSFCEVMGDEKLTKCEQARARH